MGTSFALCFLRDELMKEFSAETKAIGARVREIHPHIFSVDATEPVYWLLDYWPEVQRLEFDSVSDAAKKLRKIGRFWGYAGGANFRRGQLIAESLRVKRAGTLNFPETGKYPEAAAFTLENERTLLCSSYPRKRRFPGGKIRFNEDKSGPPSRAYLKLWEALTLAGIYPDKNDNVVDLGATPGGWSYVVASLGARVTMIDRSEPDKRMLRKFPELRFIQGDGLKPEKAVLDQATVILSDMACEPAKLFAAVREWATLPRVRLMVCTLKFHGLSDKGIIKQFAALAGGQVVHLWHNGHELTWIWIRPA